MLTSVENSKPQPRDVTDVSPELLERWMAAGDTALIDVREDFEHAEERIDGADFHPLSKFDAEAIRHAHVGRRIVFHCRTGKRSLDAANRFRRGDEPLFHLAGGIEAWKAAGRTVERPPGGPRLPIMRQVQIIAGGLVTIGVGLGAFVSPWFLAIAAFVGCGLMFAGATGWCGMARLLSLMPWNRTPLASNCCLPAK